MKSGIRILSAILVIATSFSANGRDSYDRADDIAAWNSFDPQQTVLQREEEFVEDAIEDNLEEIAWLEAGLNKGTDAELRSHARHMLTAHRKMDGDLRNYAARRNLVLDGIDAPGEVNILDIKRRQGKDWDEEWAEEMVSKHRKTIERFEEALGYVTDADLRALINNTLPTLRAHLDMASNLAARLE